MKILLVKPGGLSEVLLTTPLIRRLHRRAPSAEIHVLTGPDCAHLFQNNPFVHTVQETGREEEPSALLKEAVFDLLIDLQNDGFSRRLAKHLKTETLRLPSRTWIGFRNTAFRSNSLATSQVVDRYFEAVAPLGIVDDGEGLDYVIPDAAKVPVHDIPHSHHAGFLCIAVGVATRNQKLPLQTLQALCKRLDHPIILIGGKEEAREGEAVAFADPVKIYNACGKFSFQETADLIRQSKLLVSGASHWVQIGAALRKEIILIRKGQSSPDTAPFYGRNFLQRNPTRFEALALKASWWGFGQKPLEVNEIVQQINRRLRKK